MAKVALDGCNFVESTAPGHIQTERWQKVGNYPGSWDEDGGYIPGDPKYDWVGGYSVAAKINGTVKATTTNVFANGKKVVRQTDPTTETDTYSLGSNERYASGAHTNAQGTVSQGNSRNVYINGQLVALQGSQVRTHANTTTTVGTSQLASNVFIGG